MNKSLEFEKRPWNQESMRERGEGNRTGKVSKDHTEVGDWSP